MLTGGCAHSLSVACHVQVSIAYVNGLSDQYLVWRSAVLSPSHPLTHLSLEICFVGLFGECGIISLWDLCI